jgi:hypothetical protein
MSLDSEFFWLHLGLAGVILLAVLLLATEAGFRLGRRTRRRSDDPVRTQFGAIEGASLAIVGLLLAFTFSMSASRFEDRKLLIVHETNALGTAWLRARVLQPPERHEVQSLLRRYVDTWLELYEAAGANPKGVEPVLKELDRLQEGLWSRASDVARQNPNAVTLSLLLQSLNDVFDRQSEFVAACRNRIPGVILLMLTVAATISLGMIGYGCGLVGHRSFLATFMLSLLIVTIVVVILDFDRPKRGFFQLGPQGMTALRETMDRSANPLPPLDKRGPNSSPR